MGRQLPTNHRHEGGMEAATTDPLDIYLDGINRAVYGDKAHKQTLHAIKRLVQTSNATQLTKRMIAQEAGLTTKDLYNRNILETLQEFAVVYLIDKVNRDKGNYVIPEVILSRTLEEADSRHGLLRTDLTDNPEAKHLAQRFGKRLSNGGGVPVQSTEVSSPLEAQMESSARYLGLGDQIEISVGLEGSNQERSDYSLVISGIAHNFNGNKQNELEDFLLTKMVSLSNAALDGFRVRCPCDSLEDHLLNVDLGNEDFIPEDTHYVEFQNQRAVFETHLHKIRSEKQ